MRASLARLLPDGAMIPQQEFVDRFWSPDPGQHGTMIGPNGCGKTTLAMKLLARSQELHQPHGSKGIALVMKPNKGPRSLGKRATGDETMAKLTRSLGGRTVRSWPPPPRWPWQREPKFYTFWPKHTMDLDVDEPAHEAAFRGILHDSFEHGDRWVFADEAMGLAELNLKRELIAIWSRGRSMRCGLLAATQRPAFVPHHMYSEGRHFFLWRMNDSGAYDRIKEIGGSVDPKTVVAIVKNLKHHECLYLYPEHDIRAVLV